jgi:hypothetical protein
MPTFRNILFHLHRRVGMKCDCGWECGVLYVKRFGSKNSLNPRDSGYFSSQNFSRTIPHILNRAQAIFRAKPFHVQYPIFSTGLRLFFEPNLFTYNTPHSQPQSHFIPTRLWRWNGHSVPKRWHLNYRRRGIPQKKAHDSQNTAKVWNQEITSYSYVSLDYFVVPSRR